MHTVDWILLWSFLIGLLAVAFYTRRFSRSVADYMVAGRSAGRYLLTTAWGMSMLGAPSIIQRFQENYTAGMVSQWWNTMLFPVVLFVSLSGWVVYRWRSTRILTLAQLFEIRYSKRYRVFLGVTTWLAGIAGLVIFPSVAAKFFIHYCGLPPTISILGHAFTILDALMVFLILIALYFAFMGGQITVLITDFIQGLFTMVVVVVVMGFILFYKDWGTIVEGMKMAPAEASLLHPYHTSETGTYNFWYYIIIGFNMIFVWQCGGWNQGATCSARSPHEMRMANILAGLRNILMWGTLLVAAPIFAFAVLNHPSWKNDGDPINARLVQVLGSTQNLSPEEIQTRIGIVNNRLSPKEIDAEVERIAKTDPDFKANLQTVREVRVPMVLSATLPPVLVGMIATMMLTAFVATFDAYLLQFGGLFIQDVVLPFRKKPFEPRTHMFMLRLSIVAVALIVFLLSRIFQMKTDIQPFFSIIASVTAGGLAVPMLGALYWNGGTTNGTWASAFTGILLSVIVFVMPKASNASIFNLFGHEFRIQDTVLSVVIIVISAIVYVVVSRLDAKVNNIPRYELDKLLHRGKYASNSAEDIAANSFHNNWEKRLNITKEFTRGDKATYYFTLGWMGLLFIIFVIGAVYNMFNATGVDGWAQYWHIFLVAIFAISAFVTVWLFIGGIKDFKQMIIDLENPERNFADDGMVIAGRSHGEDSEKKS